MSFRRHVQVAARYARGLGSSRAPCGVDLAARSLTYLTVPTRYITSAHPPVRMLPVGHRSVRTSSREDLEEEARKEETQTELIMDAEPVAGDVKSVALEEEPELCLAERAKELGVQLSPWEVKALVSMTLGAKGKHTKGSKIVTHARLKNLVRERMEEKEERKTLVNAISETHGRSNAQRVLLAFDFLGSTLFSVVGTLIAGEAGMNIVGATLVGCVAAMGGGTVNNIMMGYTRGGVFWMRDVRFLYVTVAASVITFYMWPYCESIFARSLLESIYSRDDNGMIDLVRFQGALQDDPVLAEKIKSVVKPLMQQATLEDPTSLEMFEWLDAANDGDGFLGVRAFQNLVHLQKDCSSVLYAMDSVALGAFAVIGAQHGISRGMHPAVCVVSGVTICSGGIMRDLLCNRNLAFGTQSYAMATGCGALVYVFLRQLVVRGVGVPLLYRIFLGAATTVGLRILDSHNSLLSPMSKCT